MKKDRQPRRDSKDVSRDKLHPPSAMDTRARGGGKESHEPIRKQLKGSTAGKPGR
jgi:hypothetical protein